MNNRLLLLGGIAGSVAFSIATVIVGAFRTPYSHTNQFISELGETGGQYAAAMNYGGFMVGAVLLFCFVIGVWRTFPRSGASMVATVLIAAFPIGMFGAGVFSCDTGCSPDHPSLDQILHDVASLIAFPPFILGLFVWSAILLRRASFRREGAFTLFIALIATGLMALMVASEAERAMTGLWQRLLLGTFFLWISLAALRLASAQGQEISSAPTSNDRPHSLRERI